jgi:hypothetical protein
MAEEKRYQRKSLGVVVRDDRGVVDPELEREVVAIVQKWYDDLMAGRAVALGDGDLQQSREIDSTQVDAGEGNGSGPLSLKRGFDLATTVPTGLFVVETEHLKEVRRAARNIEWAIGTDDLGRGVGTS